MPDFAIQALNVSRRYGGRSALDGFSLEVPAGSTFGLLGPNGSGKSTFVAMLASMSAPEAGEVLVFGQAPQARLRAHVGVVFQENASDPLMRVAEYLHFAGRLFRVSRADLGARVPALLTRFGLGERASDRVSTLSGGMRRRLEVVRALLHEPDLLLLDEPTTGIDTEERAILWQSLNSSNASRTVLLATNDLAEADSVCDAVAFVQAGRVVAHGSPGELKAGLRKETVRVTWTAPTAEQLARLASLPGVGEVGRDGEQLVITTDEAAALIPKLFELAPRGAISSVAIATASLEDAYFQHVRRRLDGAAK